MESLPSDIILDIISRVPAESVLECKLVCRRWETLVRCSESKFSNTHLSRLLNHLHGSDDDNDNLAAKVEPCLFFACRVEDPHVVRSLLFLGGQPSNKISTDEGYIYNQNLRRIYHPPMHNEPLSCHLVGSCNGLVCTFQHRQVATDPIYICNPLTREYAYLPELVVKQERDPVYAELFGEGETYNSISCGFGYLRSTNEYKIVRIHYSKFASHQGTVQVYTLGGGCGWRAVDGISCELDTNAGTYANDSIYWTSTSPNKVVAFDLAKEEFRFLPLPVPLMQSRWNSAKCGLVALGRHLCLFQDDKIHVEIWSLMRSSDSKETWCMEVDINYEAIMGTLKGKFQPILRPILLTKNGEIILLYGKSVLYCYDRKTTILKLISNEASTDCFEAVEVIAHINTFASLEAIGENSKRYTVRSRGVHTPLDDVIDELDRVALGEGIDTARFRLR